MIKTSFVRGCAVLLTGSSMFSSHVTDGLGWCNEGCDVVWSLFARLIVACSRLFNVGTSEGFCDEGAIGFRDGFLVVDRSFVGVCFMCPLEVFGEGVKCFCTFLYVMYGHVAKSPLFIAASHVDFTG